MSTEYQSGYYKSKTCNRVTISDISDLFPPILIRFSITLEESRESG